MKTMSCLPRGGLNLLLADFSNLLSIVVWVKLALVFALKQIVRSTKDFLFSSLKNCYVAVVLPVPVPPMKRTGFAASVNMFNKYFFFKISVVGTMMSESKLLA